MAHTPLRIYFGPEDETSVTALKDTPSTVTMPLGEIFPALTEALDKGRNWPRDFEDDEITISADLYEVILAYQHYRLPSA